jgi:hypothetical protein
MGIVTWYTDPSEGTFKNGSGKFSSYYQYETVTRRFVRIRLDIERKSLAGSNAKDAGGTEIIYREKRYVGFSSKKDLPTKNNWTTSESGKLCYNGDELSINDNSQPSKNLYVYDTSDVRNPTHKGNKVTLKANLPEGITENHLRLLANHAMITGKSVKLTLANAEVDELIKSIFDNVQAIVDKKEPLSITSDDFFNKIKIQDGQIKKIALLASKANIWTSDKQSLGSPQKTLPN